MNRRSFLTRLGAAAVGAAALAIDDPERLLWIPGAKTIVDFGATKQVLPATDAEVVQQFTQRLITTNEEYAAARRRGEYREIPDYANRNIRLDIGGVSFHYKGEQLVSLHTEQELKLLDLPIGGRFDDAQAQRIRAAASAAEIELFHHLDD